jgi:hypothetical protein
MKTFWISADKIQLLSDGRGLPLGGGLEHAREDDGAVRKHVS